MTEESNGPTSLTRLEQVPDYRFARLTKGERYAYARGLTINPAHLPLALDAMAKDGWRVVCVFGETDSENVGFLFEAADSAGSPEAASVQQAVDFLMGALGKTQVELLKAKSRIVELLKANNKLVETAREQRESIRRFELLYGVLGE